MQDSSLFEIQHILPEIVLSVFGMAVILLDTFLSKAHRYVGLASLPWLAYWSPRYRHCSW